MKKLIFAILMAFSLPALATKSFSDETLTIRLFKESCKDKKVLSRLKPEFVKKYKQAHIIFEGHVIAACYAEFPDSYFLIDGDGIAVPLPKGAFKDETEI